MIRTGAIRPGFPDLLLIAAISLFGTGAVVAAQQAADPPPNAAASKPKKVYTNDDVQPAPDGAAAAAKPARSTAPSGKEPNAELARSMRAKLEKLAAQIKDADKQIDDLKRFQAGETNGDASHQWHKGYNATPIPEQLAKLEQKRSQLQEQVEAIYDEARKRGIPPGQLR
jgi:cell division protein FtsB